MTAEESDEQTQRIVGVMVGVFDVLTENLTDEETHKVASYLGFQMYVIVDALNGGYDDG